MVYPLIKDMVHTLINLVASLLNFEKKLHAKAISQSDCDLQE